MLYTVDKLSAMNKFDNSKLHKFFKIRYRQILQEPFNDEQLYFYYVIKILGFTELLIDGKNVALKSNNQILISYYLKNGIFEGEDIDILEANDNERYWFPNNI